MTLSSTSDSSSIFKDRCPRPDQGELCLTRSNNPPASPLLRRDSELDDRRSEPAIARFCELVRINTMLVSRLPPYGGSEPGPVVGTEVAFGTS